jgi:aspartate-semialdehyde dehydrogenase
MPTPQKTVAPKTVAVIGATGAVGAEMIRCLEERDFPVSSLKALASPRSAGKTLKFRGRDVTVEAVSADAFKGVDVALFAASSGISREFAPAAVKAGAVVIDNSSAFRMDPEIPLVVPEVNGQEIARHKGIIANPNCTCGPRSTTRSTSPSGSPASSSSRSTCSWPTPSSATATARTDAPLTIPRTRNWSSG